MGLQTGRRLKAVCCGCCHFPPVVMENCIGIVLAVGQRVVGKCESRNPGGVLATATCPGMASDVAAAAVCRRTDSWSDCYDLGGRYQREASFGGRQGHGLYCKPCWRPLVFATGFYDRRYTSLYNPREMSRRILIVVVDYFGQERGDSCCWGLCRRRLTEC